MALDIPNLTPNTPGEAGNLYNALSSGALDNVIKGVQAQYAPLTTMSEAASKLAYSNLMGPQFLAKLMGHPDIAANLSPEQRQNALQSLYGAGSGQMSGNALLSNPNMMGMLQPQQQPGFLSQIRSLMGGGQQQSNQPLMNAFAGQMQNQMPPQMQSQGMPQQQQQMQPQMQQQPQNQSMASAQQPVADQNAPSGNANDAWYENAARAEGIKAEGKELGGERGKVMSQLGGEYKALLNTEKSYDNFASILTNPTWQGLRNKFPLFQNTQLKIAATMGTPEEQQLIGQYKTNAQDIVRDTLNSFTGARLKGELGVSQNMKVADDDTINVAEGKVQAAMLLNQIRKSYLPVVHDLMKTQHLDEEDAYEKADKMISPDRIKQMKDQISGLLKPVSAPGTQSKASEEQISPAAKNLAKTMDLSHFQSPQEFQTWYAQQPELTQQAVRLHMKQRGGGK